MTQPTRLDIAHAAMQAAPDDGAARLRFYEALSEGEIVLLLEREAEGDQISPRSFDVEGCEYVLAFDSEARLAQFAQGVVPHAMMPGRVLIAMLEGSGAGLGVNLDVAPSSILIPPEAVAWLAGVLADGPQGTEARVSAFRKPTGLPESLLRALDGRLARAAGLAHSAYLVGVTYEGGQAGHMLGFVDALPDAEGALARAVSEALKFSGIEAGLLDVSFFASQDTAAAHLARHGLRFDLPAPPRADAPRAAPGSDPGKPPILR